MTLPEYRSVTLLYHAGAGSGKGGQVYAQAADEVRRVFPHADVSIIETKSKEHIHEVGLTCTADLILCLTGDGSIHDLAQTLLARPKAERPTLASIPAGSGNDYARSLGMPPDPIAALALLPQCVPLSVDVGTVNDTFFLETLSFGVDAAVAINTETLRLTTKARGTILYAHAAINAIVTELISHQALLTINGEEAMQEVLIFAVQNGRTYGSGFIVAPHASIVDGLLDVYTVSNLNKVKSLYYLMRMKAGKHENLKKFKIYKVPELQIEFSKQIPVQVDGEKMLGLKFKVGVLPKELEVLALPSAPACQ